MRTSEWARALVTLNGSPTGVAAGFVLGLTLSLVPIPFAGMLASVMVAPVFRMNVVAAYLGSAVVNPITGPAIYFAELWIGLRLHGQPLPTWSELASLDGRGWWELMQTALWPFLTGAGVLMLAVLVVVFPLLFVLAKRWKKS